MHLSMSYLNHVGKGYDSLPTQEPDVKVDDILLLCKVLGFWFQRHLSYGKVNLDIQVDTCVHYLSTSYALHFEGHT